MAPTQLQHVELSVDTSYNGLEVVVNPAILPPDAHPGDLLAITPTQVHLDLVNGRSKSGKPCRQPPPPILYTVPEPEPGADEGGRAGRSRTASRAGVVVSAAIASSFDWLPQNHKSAQVTLHVVSLLPGDQSDGADPWRKRGRWLTATRATAAVPNHSGRAGRFPCRAVLLKGKSHTFALGPHALILTLLPRRAEMYLGRSDMFRLSLLLTDTALNLNQRVTLPGASQSRIRVGGIFASATNKSLKSCFIDSTTQIVFRSESTRNYVFVEVSQEMWNFEEDGSMLQSKCGMFLAELMGRWQPRTSGHTGTAKRRALGATSHTVSVILYGRVIYDDEREGEEARAPLQRLEDGTLYRDFYKVGSLLASEMLGMPYRRADRTVQVVVDASVHPPANLARLVEAELGQWQKSVLLRRLDSGQHKLAGRLAYAHESPVLEATNLALNVNEKHWVDRDLHTTGFSLSIITAGTSFYQVPKDLLRLTTERMLCHGIGLDLISLSKTPLHTVPLFSFRSHEPGLAEAQAQSLSSGFGHVRRADNGLGLSVPRSPAAFSHMTASTMASFSTHHSAVTRDSIKAQAMQASLPEDQRDPLYYDPPHASLPQDTYFAEPLFVFCSFFGSQVDKPHRIDRFMPRARCYELFSQGTGERMPVAIPLLAQEAELDKDEEGWGYLSELEKKQARRDRHDAAAIGVKIGLGEFGIWPRQSGNTSGASLGSDGRRLSAASASEDDDAGMPIVTSRRRAVDRRTTSTTSTDAAEVRERGRRDRKADEIRKASASRSRTPRPQPRDASVASHRTVSASHRPSKAAAPMPALMQQFAQLAVAAPQPVAPQPRSRWIPRIFSGGTGVAAGPAPSVAVQRVDAVAHGRAEEGDDNDDVSSIMSITSDRRSSQLASASPGSSIGVGRRLSLAPAPTVSLSTGPTQPISINSRAVVKTKDIDQQRASHKLVSSSPSIPAFGAVVDQHRVDRKRAGGPSRFNPSKPGKRSLGLADQARRWASIFIRHTNDQRAVNWVSITRTACLPLTTDYLPTEDRRRADYVAHEYSIEASGTARSFFVRQDPADAARGVPAALELMTELISQRVSFGFQICLPHRSTGALSTLADILQALQDTKITDKAASTVYLSLANQVHSLRYDHRQQAVVVHVFRLKRTWMKHPVRYNPLIWTAGTPNYLQNELSLEYPNLLDQGDWENQDRLIAGLDPAGRRTSARHWRTRLVLLPDKEVGQREDIIGRDKFLESLASVTDDAIRRRGMFVLIDLIEGARWTAPGKRQEPAPIAYTDLSAPEWARTEAAQEGLAALAVDASVPPTPLVQPKQLWQRIVSPNHPREDAGASPSSAERAATPSPTRGGIDGRASPSGPGNGGNGNGSTSGPRARPSVQMTHAVVLDLDKDAKSDRAERVVCHLDRSHNVNAAYHIELTWLTSSGRMIDQALTTWARTIGRYGLKLIEVSSRPVTSSHNPFQRSWPVALVVAPPPIGPDDDLPPQ